MIITSNWITDDNDLNPPINLQYVTSFDISVGTGHHCICFKFSNNPPVNWLFSTHDEMQQRYEYLLKRVGA